MQSVELPVSRSTEGSADYNVSEDFAHDARMPKESVEENRHSGSQAEETRAKPTQGRKSRWPAANFANELKYKWQARKEGIDLANLSPVFVSGVEATGRWTDTVCIPVFFTAAGCLLLFLTVCSIWPEELREGFTTIHEWLNYNIAWLYMLVASAVVLSVLFLGFGPYGNIKLGDDDSEPEFGTVAWLCMTFCSAVGMGTVFYGVAEPVTFYNQPPDSSWSEEKRREMAVPLTLFHWGLHSWTFYTLAGLSIAYFSHRRKLPLASRSCFFPIFGKYIYSFPGHIADIFAIVGCIFGMAASLGFGSLNISAGLNYLLHTPHNSTSQIIVVLVTTAAAVASLITGVHRGIKYLSYLSVGLGLLMFLFVYFSSPLTFINDSIVEGAGTYLDVIFDRLLHVSPYGGEEKDWIAKWSCFYVSWSMACGPFNGMFYARISKGRTIRELVLGSTLVTSGVALIWFSTFGSLAINLDQKIAGGAISKAVLADPALALYKLFEYLPMTVFMSSIAMSVMIIFFVTSSDSASYVVDLLAAGGCREPPVWQRVFWGTMEGAITAVLLYGAGVDAVYALQAAVGSISVFMAIFYVLLLVSIIKAVHEDHCVHTKPLVPVNCPTDVTNFREKPA